MSFDSVSISSSDHSSSSSSLFSRESFSTSPTSRSPSPTYARPAAPRLVHPALKASSIRLPLTLPPAPTGVAEVDLKDLIVDSELKDVPIGYVLAKMRSMGSDLLVAAASTSLQIPSGPNLPSYLPCTPPSTGIAPTHLLAIHAPDSPRALLLPIHGLLYAYRSPLLSILSSHPSLQPAHPNLPSASAPPGFALPVVHLSLPSFLAFPLLQSYLYLSSPSALLSSLLPLPPPASISLASLLNPTPSSLSTAYSSLSRETLLYRVALVHGLWQDTVALEIVDEGLWDTMRTAWGILVGALAVKEQRRRKEQA